MSAVSVRDVTVAFGAVRVFDGLSLDTDLVRNSSSSKVVSTRVHTARRMPGSAWLSDRLSPTTRRRI